ncbi:MAG TPA: OmpA family protein, partial [Gemmatimonadales bacterium]|nr:OmpA family protein [Gemmatimonadales bacterium]
WPALAAAAVVALLFYLGRNPRTPEAISSTMGDDAVGAMSEAAASAATAAGAAASHLGASVRRRLADGIELMVPERGIESQVVAFLDDPNRPVDRTTWFNFDRLTFETGAARIRPESAEQLDNIAAILRAWPAARFKVGGYTDSTGDRAANQRLSQARADAVRDALVAKGIAGDRLEAEGYGDQYPVGDNATEAGREQNRRIALRVTAK